MVVMKLSVLSSGAVLLDGQPVHFEDLQKALETARREEDIVWYYRESAAQSPPQHALQVLNLVVQNQLRISLSSKPDFSDYVDSKGMSHPRTPVQPDRSSPVMTEPEEALPMPAVEHCEDLEGIFAKVRKTAAGERRRAALVVLRPDRQTLVLPAMAQTPALRHAALSLERLVPASIKRNIAVIAYTVFPGGDPNIHEVGRAIPFLGMLMGLAYIGHAVWVFEGHPAAFLAGCRHADVLIADSSMVASLQEGWQDSAAGVMRNANILVHDRGTFQLRILHKVGEQLGALGFAD